MKKFLTVLLVIAVMFTFSFSTSFAAVGVPGETGGYSHYEAMAKAVKELNDEFAAKVKAAKAALVDEYVDVYGDKNSDAPAFIAKSVYENTLDKMVADFASIVNAAYAEVDKHVDTKDSTDVDVLKNALKAKKVQGIVISADKVDQELTAQAYLDFDLLKYVTEGTLTNDAVQGYYQVYTWVNALPRIKADMNAVLAKIDMSLYTDDVIDKNAAYPQTYAEKAAEIKAELEKAVNNTVVSMSMTREEAYTAIWQLCDKVNKAVEPVSKTELIDGSVLINSFKLTDASLKTKDELEGDKLTDDAKKAALIAEIKANVAAYQKNALEQYNNDMKAAKTDADKAKAKADYEGRLKKLAAYEEVYTVLVQEGKITSVEKDALGKAGNKALDRVAKYEAAQDLAAALKLQVEKEGSAKYDAAVIDEILKELKVKIYAEGYSATVEDFAKALIAYDHFNWDKELLIADINTAKAGKLAEGFYAPEKEKVEAIYAAAVAKVEAAANVKQLAELKTKAIREAGLEADKIDTKGEVRAKLTPYINTDKFFNAVNKYIGYLNMGANADGQRALATKDDVVKYLAGEGARTNADIAELLTKAETYAQSVKTVGEIREAKLAIDKMLKELPNLVTLEHKEAVKAVWSAAQDANYMTNARRLVNAVGAVQAAESKAIDDMLKALPAKLTAADKDAVDAILKAIEAFDDEEMYTADYAKKAEAVKAFKAVRSAVLADVHAAIAAIPASPTRATVDAARKAYDEFVKEYTDAYADDIVAGERHGYHAVDYVLNYDKLTYAEAQLKAKEIKAVESMKLRAYSKYAKKGITVKWVIEDGRKSDAAGYQVWRSTKANSGYKKLITVKGYGVKNTKNLKKGTTYYYKVRAYKRVDGKLYFSDWSNKAYRKAK